MCPVYYAGITYAKYPLHFSIVFCFQLTTSALAQSLEFIALSSPAYDNVPVFRWSTSPFRDSVKHVGHPDLWDFKPVTHKWGTRKRVWAMSYKTDLVWDLLNLLWPLIFCDIFLYWLVIMSTWDSIFAKKSRHINLTWCNIKIY
jgi:hypothetical protein